MTFTRGRLIKGSLGAAAVLVAGGAVAGTVWAQSTPQATPWAMPGRMGGGMMGPDMMGPGMMGSGPGGPMGLGTEMGTGMLLSTSVLTRLGMTADQVLVERQAGKSLTQIAQAKGVDRAALVSAIVDEHKGFMAAHVTAGQLTQAQLDTMVGLMKQRVETAVDFTAPAPITSPRGPSGRRGMWGTQ
jgi:hypothetical protein